MKGKLAGMVLVLLLAGCQSSLAPIPPRSTPSPIALATTSTDVWATLEQIPLHIPTITPGDPCPVSPGSLVDSNFGAALGGGPIYLVGFGQQGVVDLDQAADYQNGLFTVLLLVIAPPAYAADMLVRGQQVDGPSGVLFSASSDSEPFDGWKLNPDDAGRSDTGWLAWSTNLKIGEPGCYGLQIDSAGFSEVVVFQAIQGQGG